MTPTERQTLKDLYHQTISQLAMALADVEVCAAVLRKAVPAGVTEFSILQPRGPVGQDLEILGFAVMTARSRARALETDLRDQYANIIQVAPELRPFLATKVSVDIEPHEIHVVASDGQHHTFSVVGCARAIQEARRILGKGDSAEVFNTSGDSVYTVECLLNGDVIE